MPMFCALDLDMSSNYIKHFLDSFDFSHEFKELLETSSPSAR